MFSSNCGMLGWFSVVLFTRSYILAEKSSVLERKQQGLHFIQLLWWPWCLAFSFCCQYLPVFYDTVNHERWSHKNVKEKDTSILRLLFEELVHVHPKYTVYLSPTKCLIKGVHRFFELFFLNSKKCRDIYLINKENCIYNLYSFKW